MPIEIEWKFVVVRMPAPAALATRPGVVTEAIDQGYFSAEGAPAVRVRTKGAKASLDVKAAVPPAPGAPAGGPQVCREFQYAIPRADAEALLLLAPWRIRKTRHTLPDGLEVDVFEGPHAGLVVAEMEVAEAGAAPSPPAGWEWRDVSQDIRYVNRAMAQHGVPPDAPRCVFV
jgi:adenylate cyclase